MPVKIGHCKKHGVRYIIGGIMGCVKCSIEKEQKDSGMEHFPSEPMRCSVHDIMYYAGSAIGCPKCDEERRRQSAAGSYNPKYCSIHKTLYHDGGPGTIGCVQCNNSRIRAEEEAARDKDRQEKMNELGCKTVISDPKENVRRWLVVYSWSNYSEAMNTYQSGFGNVFETHFRGQPITKEDIERIERDMKCHHRPVGGLGKDYCNIVIINIIEYGV